jgi:hypothetical protein
MRIRATSRSARARDRRSQTDEAVASRYLSASVTLSQLALRTWLLLSNRRHVGVLALWRLPTAHLDYGLLASSSHQFA